MGIIHDDFKADIIHAEGRLNYVYLRDGEKYAGIGHRLLGTDAQMAVGARVYDEQVDHWFTNDTAFVYDTICKYFTEFNEYPRLVKLAILGWIYQRGKEAPLEAPLATAAIIAKDWKTAANHLKFSDRCTRRLSRWMMEAPTRCMQEIERLRSAKTWRE